MNSSNEKILFLVFSPLFDKGGHSKNFLNLIKHLEPEIYKNDVEAVIVSYNNNSYGIEFNSENISKYLYFKSYKIKLLKRYFPSGKVIFQVLEFLLNFIKTFFIIIKNKPNVVYAYSDKTLYLSFPFKYIFNYKLIYDMRGDVLNELKVQGASRSQLKILSKIHKFATKSTNLLFTVSSGININGKTQCVPKYNYYDGEVFQYNESLMVKKKGELGLENKFVFVYTGNAHYYQFLEGTIKFFRQFQNKYPDTFFLIITEFESDKFLNLLDKYNVPVPTYLIQSLPQDEIAELQQIADMGFLLREDLPLNHHSFPTKFAEYLASGVPVLMTPHIHSIVPMVKNNNLGEVITINDNNVVDIDSIYMKYKNNREKKKHCSLFAQNELMWQKKAKDIFLQINNV